jgi:sulfur carrier protein
VAAALPRPYQSLALTPPRVHIAAMEIAITLNGEPRAVSAATVADLLREIGLDTRKVAVERNEEIVPRSTYADTRLTQGDQLEIVHFIGGG